MRGTVKFATDATEAVLIYPHQLYEEHPAIHKNRLHLLIEDPLFFGDTYNPLKFHKQKLVLHRASMKWYAKEVLGAGRYEYEYIDYTSLKEGNENLENLLQALRTAGIKKLHITDPTDYLLQRRICRYVNKLKFDYEWYDTPNFLSTRKAVEDYLDTAQKYFQTDFYKWQRRRLDLLLEPDGNPTGGQWSFDAENRKRLPKDEVVPTLESTSNGEEEEYIAEAKQYINKNFPDNPGSTDVFNYCISHAAAKQWFKDFTTERLGKFGPYQDAITTRSPFVFHSVTSFALNIGLLDPHWLLDHTMEYAMRQVDVEMRSVEGFIRQVIGWREFMRVVYIREGNSMRRHNHFKYHRKIPKSFYTGETGILPIDNVIKKLQKYAYAHHIERLMLLGNFMLLCEFDPNEVYNWFMEMFIDSYDWVMVPNIYGMSQYADGGLIVTKPYVSSSNYVIKMSDYTGNQEKEGEWANIWDALYWCFIEDHKSEFNKNHRMKMMVHLLEKKTDREMNQYRKLKDSFLKNLN